MTEFKIEKRCPECGRELLVRVNRQNDSEFLGCVGFPECRHTEALPESIRMQRLGHPTLPGLS